jgi:putative membrane protein
MKRIFFVFIMYGQMALSACTRGPYSSPMGNRDRLMEYGHGGGFMWIILLVIVGVVIYFLIQVSKSKNSDVSTTETPLDILKKRYAKGDIEKEEFEQKKKDLEP